ncbi:MAG: cbb3-type cytochrome c oxidase N-terminal domain-containing protein [Verrucomicrobiota bacterium]|jgi:cytochrome c oxidase cbb3-type subunit 3
MSQPCDPFKDPLLLDHEADGIRELDNNLPRWWVWLFNLSIVFAAGYLGYYHVFHLGDLQAAQYVRESKLGDASKAEALKKFEDSLPMLTPSKDQAVLSHGKEIFLGNCAPCHREDGGGKVGPNLCDEYWIHGSNFVDNLHVIVNGVPAKGMVTWRGILKPAEIHAVASYIYTLRGTHPPNPKPPENLAQPAAPNPYE